MGSNITSAVINYYDTHPINEEQILGKLRERGLALEAITEDVLCEYDQDHYGGVDAVRALAAAARIDSSHHVLDVCSGMGGPARYLAHTIGCRVTGLDITESRYRSAQRLTELARLTHLVDFCLGDATAMPIADATFDIVIGQEAWLHIPDKPKLIQECARVLKPGGVIAFTDTLQRRDLDATQQERMAREMCAPVLGTERSYREYLAASGCALESFIDLSEPWTRILQDRLAMYRSLRAQTVAKFGVAHHEQWDSTYSFYVGLFSAGVLGGGRFVARKR